MLVLNTIELRRRSPKILCLETTLSVRLVGAFLTTFPFYLIVLTSSDSYPSKTLMIVSLTMLVAIGLYLFGRFKRLCLNASDQLINLWLTFLFIPIKSEQIAFNQVSDFKIEERSYGQTFQKKYRLFLVCKEIEIDIGVVNDLKVAEAIKKKILNHISSVDSIN